MAHGMLPLALREGDFKRVLQELVSSTRRLSGASVSVRYSGEQANFPTGRVAEQLYRIVQESVSNAIKHGRATRISLAVHAKAAKVMVSVSDDGAGFDAARSSTGMGLQIMQDRARMLGGLFDVRRARRGGTRVLCVVPQAEQRSAV